MSQFTIKITLCAPIIVIASSDSSESYTAEKTLQHFHVLCLFYSCFSHFILFLFLAEFLDFRSHVIEVASLENSYPTSGDRELVSSSTCLRIEFAFHNDKTSQIQAYFPQFITGYEVHCNRFYFRQGAINSLHANTVITEPLTSVHMTTCLMNITVNHQCR